MRFWNVPLTQLRGLVFVEIQVDSKRSFSDRRGEVQISRRVVNGIAAEYQQHIHLTRVHVRDKLSKRCVSVDGVGFDWARVDDSLANIAKRLIHRVSKRVNGRWLGVSGDHDARAGMIDKILRDKAQPLWPLVFHHGGGSPIQ